MAAVLYQRSESESEAARRSEQVAADAGIFERPHSRSLGPDDAPVKVFVFSDFQCPVCRRVVEPVKKLARDYGPKVQIVFKQNALKMHRNAEIAAGMSHRRSRPYPVTRT